MLFNTLCNSPTVMRCGSLQRKHDMLDCINMILAPILYECMVNMVFYVYMHYWMRMLTLTVYLFICFWCGGDCCCCVCYLLF